MADMLRLKVPPPVIIAHRGYRQRFPENTLAAFAAAFDAGAHMVELDVTLTRDRQVVVLHDETLNRTTDGKGRVRQRSLADLKQLDAGGWFHPQFSGERLPTLDEVLDLCAGQGLVNIEIKPNAFEASFPPDAIERQVVKAASKRALSDCILVSSSVPGIIRRIAALPDAPAVAMVSGWRRGLDPVTVCRTIGAYSWHPNHRTLTAKALHLAHAAGLKVFPYTVNKRAEIQRLLQLGIDGLITDDPPLVRDCIGKAA